LPEIALVTERGDMIELSTIEKQEANLPAPPVLARKTSIALLAPSQVT